MTILQKSHAIGGFRLTPNVIAQTSARVPMAARFLGLVGSLPSDEQQLWLPNQLAHLRWDSWSGSRTGPRDPGMQMTWIPGTSLGQGQIPQFYSNRLNFFAVTLLVYYYESIKREPKIRGIYECRCDERLQTKSKEFTRLTYTREVSIWFSDEKNLKNSTKTTVN